MRQPLVFRLGTFPPDRLMPARAGKPAYANDRGSARSKDPASEAEIYARLLPGLQVLLRQRLGGSAAVDDLVQEALIVVLNHWRSGEIADSAQLVSFTRTTAVNMVANLRRSDRRRELLSCAARSNSDFESSPDPETIVAQEELRVALREAVGSMRNSRDRQLLALYYFEEQSKVEICAVLSMELRRFDKVLHRARARLRESIERNAQMGGRNAALKTFTTISDAD